MDNQLEVLRKIREQFLSERAKQEMQVSAWAERITKCDPEVLEGIELPNPLTLRALIPELYADSPRQEVYEEQYDKAVQLFNQVNERADALLREAEKLIAEYRAVVARGV